MMMPGKIPGAVAVAMLSLFLISACTTGGEQVKKAVEEATVAEGKEVAKSAAAAPAARKEAAGAAEKKKPEPSVSSSVDKVKSSIYLGSDGKPAGMGNPENPVSEAYKIGMSERPAALAGAGLPKDRFGLVDWVAVVEKGEIDPVGSLDPKKPDVPPFDMDVIIAAKGDFVNDVMFPHDIHTYWLGCENCHPAIFVMGKGKNKMSMAEIAEGKWCGRCHGKVAFPLTDCARCHTEKKARKKVVEKG